MFHMGRLQEIQYFLIEMMTLEQKCEAHEGVSQGSPGDKCLRKRKQLQHRH